MKKDLFRKDRICYILEETFNYLIGILISGSYLAKVTTSLGISDGLTAILSAFVTIGCSAQLLSTVFFKKGRVKRRITAIFMVNQLLFTLLYLVPSVQLPNTLRTVIFAVLLLAGNIVLNLVLAPRTNWYMSFVDSHKRGSFTARKEAISLVSGMLFQFAMSALIDHFEARGELRTAFIICAVVVFSLSVGHTLSLVFTKDREVPENNQSLSRDMKGIVSDKGIRPLILLNILWAVCGCVAIPFYGTYKIKELGFSMSFVAFEALVYAVTRVIASVFLGRYADKYSFGKMLRLCYCFLALGFATAVFVAPANGRVLYTAYCVLNAISMGGINSAEINLVFERVSPEKRTATLSITKTIYGIVGFLVSAAATPLLNHIQSAGNRFLGMQIYAQQVLSGIALLFSVLTALYIHFRILKPWKTEAHKS